MIDSRVMRFSLALLASTAVAGCLGGGSGGGNSTVNPGSGGVTNPGGSDTDPDDGGTTNPGGSTGSSDYEAEFDRVTAIAPTSDMPTSIQATYAGQMRADVTDSSEIVGEIVGDVNLDVAWTDGQGSNPFSGGASNFQGRATGGEFEAIDGTLSVDPAFGATIARTVIPAGNIGGFNIPETQTGAMQVTLTGQLSQGDSAADTTVLLGGNFFGAGASAAVGAVSGGFSDASTDSPAIFDGAIGGTYYLERQ